jgi:AcrR family transcriptional regulator
MDRAAELIYERGFHATGIDDIGEAAGISGPAIYRHFKSKDDLLLAIIERTVEHATEVTEARRMDDGDPAAQLRRHVETQVGLAVQSPHLGPLVANELANLQSTDRSRVVRKIRLNRAEWMHVMSEARPELSESAIHLRLDGVVGLIREIVSPRAVAENTPEELIDLVTSMVLAVIYA